MKNRTLSILEAAVKDFIESGRPVSSRGLYEEHDFGVKSASIRTELNVLTESGFLSQPHTSSGRIPTNRGYQFYVEKLLEKPLAAEFDHFWVKDWIGNELSDFIEDISDDLRLLSVGYRPERREIYKSGLDDLVAALDFETKNDIFDVIRDFEMIEDRIGEILNYLSDKSPRIFVGKSPITKSRLLSVVADCYGRSGSRRILIAIGPKRMNYSKVIKMFKTLHSTDD